MPDSSTLKQYQVVASIVTYNTPAEQLLQTIQSFLSVPLQTRLLLVDNASTNSPVPHLPQDPRIQSIESSVNRGFGSGHNLAFRQAPPSHYYLILNPDITFQAEHLLTMIQFMESHPEIGLLTPRILNPDGTTQLTARQLPTVLSLLCRRFPRRWHDWDWVRQQLEHYEMKDHDATRIHDAPFISGCFMLFRKSVLDEVGHFDERFFMYFEDVDLTRRVSAKHRAIYYPDAEVIHHWKGGARNNWKLFKELVRSGYLYFQKWGWQWR